jgi:hypothetical protein
VTVMNHYIVHFDVHPASVQDFGPDFEGAYKQLVEFEFGGRKVVLLVADSIDTIKLTHGNYFKSFDELLAPPR